MIVCVCNRVSDRTIVAQAQSGKSFDEIQFDLQVGLQCGNCEGCARDVVEQDVVCKGDLVATGDIVLVKGSKSSRISTVVDALRRTRQSNVPDERTA